MYGILHSPDYRTAFAADLKKSLPRIPQVPTAEDFWAFADAGRELAHWAIEHDDPTYILDLVGRVVTVSMRTLDLVDSLPSLDL